MHEDFSFLAMLEFGLMFDQVFMNVIKPPLSD